VVIAMQYCSLLVDSLINNLESNSWNKVLISILAYVECCHTIVATKHIDHNYFGRANLHYAVQVYVFHTLGKKSKKANCKGVSYFLFLASAAVIQSITQLNLSNLLF